MRKLKWYLVGPIQYVEDYITWRQKMVNFLESLGHEGLMPWGEIYHSKWVRGEYKKWATEMKPEDFCSRVRKHMRGNVLNFDINALLDSDGIIFYLPKDTKTVGSHGEITLAYYLKRWVTNGKKKWFEGKKIFLITDIPIEEMPYWLIGCSDYIFFSMEEFEKYFKENFDRKKGKKIG